MTRRVEVPPHVADVIRQLPPDLKSAVRATLRELARDPTLGDPLGGELEGLRKVRVRRYRIVYALDRRSRALQLFAVGHRRDVYEGIAARRRHGRKDIED